MTKQLTVSKNFNEVEITGKTKGEVMALAYGVKHYSDIRNVDIAVPDYMAKEIQETRFKTFFLVMDYNDNLFGVLTDLREQAMKLNIRFKLAGELI